MLGSFAGVGVALWLIPRLLKTELAGGRYAIAGAVLWNGCPRRMIIDTLFTSCEHWMNGAGRWTMAIGPK